MESNFGSSLHPMPGDVEAALAGETQAPRKTKLRMFRKTTSTQEPEIERLVVSAPRRTHKLPFAAVRVSDGPTWAVTCSVLGSVATGGSDGVVRVRSLKALASKIGEQCATSDDVELRGHGGSVLDCAWAPSKENETLVSVSDDRTARLWKVVKKKKKFDSSQCCCVMEFSHGGPATCCAFLDGDSFVTGALDRTLRLWHVPSGKATSWAHFNDAVTAVAATSQRITGPKKNQDGKRLAVGLRGGQIFGYLSKNHANLDFDEMVLSTIYAGAFLDAERCGASGINDPTTEEATTTSPTEPTPPPPEAATTTEAPPPSTGEEENGGGTPAKKERLFSRRRLSRLFSRRPQRQEEVPARLSVTEEVSLASVPPPVLDDDDELEDLNKAPTVDFVKQRVTSLGFYLTSNDQLELHDRLRLVTAANGQPDAAVFPGARPDKPSVLDLSCGDRVARLSLGCGVNPSESGKVAVGSAEDGALLFWRIDNDALGGTAVSTPQPGVPKKPPPPAMLAEPEIVDCVVPNVRVAAVTKAVFAPAQAAKAALTWLDDDDRDWSATAALAVDYSGRLILLCYDARAHVKLPLGQPKKKKVPCDHPPGTGKAVDSAEKPPVTIRRPTRSAHKSSSSETTSTGRQRGDSPPGTSDSEEFFTPPSRRPQTSFPTSSASSVPDPPDADYFEEAQPPEKN